MTEEQIALARRAVACRGWRWMPGMLDQWGLRYAGTHVNHTRAIPDVTDPATLGCLLALVREAFPGCHAEPNGAPEWDGYDEAERDNWWSVFTCGPHRLMANGATEAAALVAALEAAP
jgi:hypothetical protein